MGKCKKCGRKGFFFKVNSDGLCKNCEVLEQLENQEKLLNEKVSALSSKLSDQEHLMKELSEQAKKEALSEIENQLSQKKDELTQLKSELETTSLAVEEAAKKEQRSLKTYENTSQKTKQLSRLIKSIQYALKKYSTLEIDDSAVFLPDLDEQLKESLSPTIQLKLHCMDVKQLRKEYKNIQKQIQEILSKYEKRYTTKANQAIYRLMVLALEAEIQNILFNLRYEKLDESIEDVKTMTQKYLVIASEGNQSIAPTMITFIGEIEFLFIEAVKVEYEYYSQKERIKEEQRALREQMKQEAEERKILEQQKKQVEKEESKYKNEMISLQSQLENTTEDAKVQELQKRLEELQEQLNSVQDKKEDIINRQNGKAGYVYVISNLGSFGENIFKIGMTRRLEPQDRINELSNASVPFPFDVHSFIFSDDAVALEHNIHTILNSDRVNKVNLRKEFFRVSLDRLEELVYELQPTAEFNRTMLAEQYNQSISMSEPVSELYSIDSESDEDEAEEDEATEE